MALKRMTTEANMTWKKIIAGVTGLSLAVLFNLNCASTSVVKSEPEPSDEPVIGEAASHIEPAPVAMKPYHRAMGEEMRRSFRRADEIILAFYTGTRMDKPEGKTFYFDKIFKFNQETHTWGSVTNVLLPVIFRELKPEIIYRYDFKSLSKNDRIGICWDYYDETRFVYLIEGEYSLLFLCQEFDEKTYINHRILIDIYPVTKYCNAKKVFELMVRQVTTSFPGRR
jgi:hypothetical protein